MTLIHVGLKMNQRLRRWPTIKPMWDQRLTFGELATVVNWARVCFLLSVVLHHSQGVSCLDLSASRGVRPLVTQPLPSVCNQSS